MTQELKQEQDIEIVCEDCNEIFIFSINEQKFYADKNFVRPKRCKTCRNIRKNNRI